MRALHAVVNSAVALLLVSVAIGAAEAQTSTGKAADAQAPSNVVAGSSVQEPQVAYSALPSETQSVHIQVGRSIILNTQARLRRIVVSNPDVLDTTTISTSQVVVTAKQPGSSSLVLWDEGSNAHIVDVYSDVDVSGLRDGIRAAYPNEPVQIEADQGRVVASGKVSSKAVEDGVLRIAGGFTKNVVDSLTVVPKRERQIMLKVTFAEVDRTKIEQFGINILSTGAANTVGTVSTGQFSPPTLGTTTSITNSIGASAQGFTTSLSASNLLNIFLFNPSLNLGATIQDLQSKNIAQILAEPNLMARSGETAKFLAGGEFPFPVVQGGVGNAVAVTIQFKPYGVKLEFTGTIESGDVIRLKIAPEVSALDYTNAVQISGYEIPALSTRRAETEIDLKNGQGFGIAGLLDKRTTEAMSKIPGIGDIPVLGQLFRSKSLNRSNTELLVFVTPIIVDPLSEQGAYSPEKVKMPVRNLVGKDKQDFDQSVGPKPESTTNNK